MQSSLPLSPLPSSFPLAPSYSWQNISFLHSFFSFSSLPALADRILFPSSLSSPFSSSSSSSSTSEPKYQYTRRSRLLDTNTGSWSTGIHCFKASLGKQFISSAFKGRFSSIKQFTAGGEAERWMKMGWWIEWGIFFDCNQLLIVVFFFSGFGRREVLNDTLLMYSLWRVVRNALWIHPFIAKPPR